MSEASQIASTPPTNDQGGTSNPQTQRSRTNANPRRRQNRTISTNYQSYQGECEDIGYILGLQSERFDKKVQFQVFLEKLGTYIVSNLKDGGYIQPLYSTLSDPNDNFATKHKPVKPEPNNSVEIDEVDQEIYRKEVKQFMQRKINMRRNLEKAYGLIWGQCLAGLQTYIKGLSYYETSSSKFDALWLLREIKKATSGIDNKSNAYVSMHDAISQLYQTKQGNQESNDNYLARFKTNIAAVELTGVKHVFPSPTISGMTIQEMTQQDLEEEMGKSKAIILLKCVDNNRFSALSKRLRDAMYLDHDKYPISIATMYDLMIKSCGSIQANNSGSNTRNRRTGVSLLQQSETNDNDMIAGTDGRVFDIVCCNCNRRGHYASYCPEATNRAGISNLQCGYIMTQAEIKHGLIPPDWVLLDTCSTGNVTHNLSLLQIVENVGVTRT